MLPAAWTAICAGEDVGEDCEVLRSQIYVKEGFPTNAINILSIQVGIWNDKKVTIFTNEYDNELVI